jgi:serine/threonine protein kinase
MLRSGDVVRGKYLVKKLLGEGISTWVYLADEIQQLAPAEAALAVDLSAHKVLRSVALKVFYKQAWEVGTKPFLEVAQRLTALNHPNIMAIYDYFQEEAYFDCIVMEYAEGGTLAELLQARQHSGERLLLAEVQQYFLQIVDGVAYAHSQQLWHGALTSQNMLFSEGRLVITDFGLAKVMAGAVAPELYRSPEQKSGQVGWSSDIYALGVILYELLSGATQQIQDLPNLLVLRPDLPPALQTFLEKLTAKDPVVRPTAAQLRPMFEAAVSGGSLTKALALTTPSPTALVKVDRPSAKANTDLPLRGGGGRVVRRGRSDWLSQVLVIAVPLIFLLAVVLVISLLVLKPGENKATLAVSAKYLNTLSTGKDAITAVAFSPDGSRLLSGSMGATQLWTWAEAQVSINFSYAGLSVMFGPDGKSVGINSPDSTFRLVKLDDGSVTYTLAGQAVTFSPDGRWLAGIVTDSNAVRGITLWDASTRVPVASFARTTAPLDRLVFSPDSQWLVGFASTENKIEIWQVNGAKQLSVLTDQLSNKVTAVAFSPDSKQLVSASDDGILKLWDVASGKTLVSVRMTTSLRAVVFSPDGRLLAVGDQRGQILLVQAADLAQLQTLNGYTSDVNALAFSPDGKLLASGGADARLVLWQVQY